MVKIKKRQELDPVTGEIIKEVLEIDLNKKNKIRYDKDKWVAMNQMEVCKMFDDNLLTVKGKVYAYLISVMEYGNFASLNVTYLSNQIDTSRQAIYKALKELTDDGRIKKAINKRTGVKGYYISDDIVQKGNDKNDDIEILEVKQEKQQEQQEQQEEQENKYDINEDLHLFD